ncbi:hypothetical protein BB558_004218 [Smittium angustum]|uniref:Uncharacterized protein n=1 Tax=Smittium angustum TaxID=133377 RepID=A0A2U1J3U1_SMIAN|nr:hypothetical protein BB558_004218 [Smittium angustum]
MSNNEFNIEEIQSPIQGLNAVLEKLQGERISNKKLERLIREVMHRGRVIQAHQKDKIWLQRKKFMALPNNKIRILDTTNPATSSNSKKGIHTPKATTGGYKYYAGEIFIIRNNKGSIIQRYNI